MAVVFFVYLLTFANGKVYVGMSRTDARGLYTNRYRQHASAARSGKHGFLYSAWRKHGDPDQTTLSRHASRDLCALAEIDAIQAHDSMNPARGYNLAPGGEGLHAPKGSALYQMLWETVWSDPARLARISAALKGRPLSAATKAAQLEWARGDDCKAFMREMTRRPEVRAKLSAVMHERLRSGFREYLSEVQRGKPRSYSSTPEKLASRKAKLREWLDSDAGKAAVRAGAVAMRANPENEAKRKAAQAIFASSEGNKQHCAAMGAKARKPVKDLATGAIYESRTAAAEAFGVTGPTIGYWVKNGKFAYV